MSSEAPRNPVVDAANTATKFLVMDVIFEGAEKAARSAQPWLNLPVISQIFSMMMKFCGQYIFKNLSIEAAQIIIGVQVGQQRDEYKKEVEQLQTAIKEGRSKDEIEKERAEAKERLRKLINFDIS